MSSTCRIVNFIPLIPRATSFASFIFLALVSPTSNTIGIVHGRSFDSLPFRITFSKSSFIRNPSRGLKIPSAMFSMSFARSASTETENNCSGSFFVILFTSLPPCGFVIPMPDSKMNHLLWSACNPHSFCGSDSHHQRPALRGSPDLIARVQGSHPILGNPLS